MKKNNMPNALLIYTESESSLSMEEALQFSANLLCQNNGVNACENCLSCKIFKKKNHPDIFFLFPSVAPKNDSYDAQYLDIWSRFLVESKEKTYLSWLNFANIGSRSPQILKNSFGELMNWMSIPPTMSNCKIVYIAFAEHMNHFTYNALLKYIEEPQDNLIYILTSDNKPAIPETILSRCQKKLIQENKINNSLIFFSEASEELSSVFDKKDSFTLFKIWMRGCYKKDFVVLNEIAELFYKEGFSGQKKFLCEFIQILNSLIKYDSHVINNDELMKNEDFSKFITKYSQTINSDEAIEELICSIDQSCNNLARNANAKLAFLNLSILSFKLF